MDNVTRAFADELTMTATEPLVKISRQVTQGSTLGDPREVRASMYRRLMDWLRRRKRKGDRR